MNRLFSMKPLKMTMGKLRFFLMWLIVTSVASERFNLMPSSALFGVDPSKRQSCKPVPPSVLKATLGPAFNGRYMSPLAPNDIDSSRINRQGVNVSPIETLTFPSFDVDERYSEVLSDAPAWLVPDGGHPDVEVRPSAYLDRLTVEEDRQKGVSRHRRIRDSGDKEPWHCQPSVKWLDLGPDYYPRYQRHVLCQQQKCWYNTFECRARSFTVKVLRRAGGRCVYNNGTGVGMAGLENGYYESWVWEERAVPYCCDCVSVGNRR